MASKTDERQLRVYLFELVNQDTDNYSPLINFGNAIDSNEPNTFSDDQITILGQKGFVPFNFDRLTIKRDPLKDPDVTEANTNMMIPEKLGRGATLKYSTRIDPGYDFSRLVNVIDQKQLLLRNRFDKSKLLHTSPLKIERYSPTTSLTTKLEFKYVFNYKQLFADADGESIYKILTKATAEVTNLRILNTRIRGLSPITTPRITIEWTLDTLGLLVVEIDLGSVTESQIDETEILLSNKITAFFQEEMEYDISTVNSYDDKLEKEYNERKISFNLPYRDDLLPILNRINSRQTESNNFGFVIFDKINRNDVFVSNSLGQEVLTSDDTKIVDYGYILNNKELKNGFNISGRRAILPFAPNILNKRIENAYAGQGFYSNAAYQKPSTANWTITAEVKTNSITFTCVSVIPSAGNEIRLLGGTAGGWSLPLTDAENYTLISEITASINNTEPLYVTAFGVQNRVELNETRRIGQKFTYNESTMQFDGYKILLPTISTGETFKFTVRNSRVVQEET